MSAVSRRAPLKALVFLSAIISAPVTALSQDREPQRGGNLVYAQTNSPDCLDLVQSANVNNGVRQALANLVDQDRRSGEIVPWLATSWEFQDDGKTLVLQLRENVTFSNGQAFDAEAVKAFIENVIQLGRDGYAGQAAGYLVGYLGADIIGPHRIALRFAMPRAGLLQALSEKTLGILAPETLRRTPEERCQGQLIAAGPFVIGEYVRNNRLVLRRREDYAWPSANATNQGPAYLDSITIRIVPEVGVKVGMLISGQVDVIDEVSVDDVPQIEAAGARIVSRNGAGIVSALHPNLGGILREDAVRIAIQKSINRSEVMNALFLPFDRVATSILSSSVPGYANLGDRLTYDPAGAARVLDAAGWTMGPDGIRRRNGQRLRLLALNSVAAYNSMLVLLREQLAQVGIELEMPFRTNAEVNAIARSGRYDLRLTSYTRADPDILLSIYSSRYFNMLRVVPPALDAVLDEQSVVINAAERAAVVQRAQEVILAGNYAFPIKEFLTIFGVRGRVHGLWLSTPQFPVFSDTWIERN